MIAHGFMTLPKLALLPKDPGDLVLGIRRPKGTGARVLKRADPKEVHLYQAERTPNLALGSRKETDPGGTNAHSGIPPLYSFQEREV